jgi:hypothetical protein
LGRSSVFVSRISWHAGSSGGSRIKKNRSKKHLKKQLHACGGTSNMSSDAKALDIRRSKNTMESTNPNAHQQRGFFLIRQTVRPATCNPKKEIVAGHGTLWWDCGKTLPKDINLWDNIARRSPETMLRKLCFGNHAPEAMLRKLCFEDCVSTTIITTLRKP